MPGKFQGILNRLKSNVAIRYEFSKPDWPVLIFIENLQIHFLSTKSAF